MSNADNDRVEGEEKRGFFRVDDVISVVVNPFCAENGMDEEFLKNLKSSKAFSLMDVSIPLQTGEEEGPAGNRENEKLYGMMDEIKTKLDFIINHFMLEKEGLLPAEKKLVNISASGIRFVMNHPAKVNDVMEVKMLLPTCPPVAVFAYGKVMRVRDLGENHHEVALEFLNMADSVRNEIIQYTLAHQRETIRKKKEARVNE